MRASVCSVQEM